MDIIRFKPEDDTRLKEMAAAAKEDAVIKPIYSYLKQYGAVRRDVYEFLLQYGTSALCKTDYNFLVELLRLQAERAWYDLFIKIGQVPIVNTLYKKELVEAFRAGLPIDAVAACYDISDTPYDMGMAVRAYEATSEEEQQAQEEMKPLYDESEKKEMMEEKSEEKLENIIEEEDGLEEKKKIIKKGKLLQSLRRYRHRAAISKMTEQKKMEELFILLRQQRYTTKMIRDVRAVIEYGISFEFLYAFVESEATETELEALVQFKAPIAEE